MGCTKLNAGDMRHRITMQNVSNVVGDGGQKTETWATIDEVWASLKTKGHSPIERAGKLEYITTTIFKVRYKDTYVAARRIVFGSRTFNVVRAVNIDEANKVVEFTCTEKGV